MKIITFIITFLLPFISFTQAQDFWEIVDPHKNVESVDMNQSGVLYIGAEDTITNNVGLYRSEDYGANWDFIWQSVNDHEPLAIHCTDNEVYFGNQYRLIQYIQSTQSFDTLFSAGISNIRCIFKGNTGNIYFGTNVLWRSTDNGQSWDTLFNPGDNPEYIYDILNLSPDTLLVATINWLGGPGGIYRSTDGGETWDWVLEDYWGSSLEKTTDGVLFTGGYGFTDDPYHQVHASYDSGETWEEVYSLYLLQVQDMAITPNNVIYFGAIEGYPGINGVYRSFDYGDTWNQVESEIITPSSEVYEVEALPDGRIYVCANRNEPGVMGLENLHRTTDPLYTNVSHPKPASISFTVQPNPATEQVTFERSMTDKEGLLRLYNVNGTTIRKAHFNKGQKQLKVNVSSWPSGMYLARIVNQGRNLESVKFVVR